MEAVRIMTPKSNIRSNSGNQSGFRQNALQKKHFKQHQQVVATYAEQQDNRIVIPPQASTKIFKQ